MLVLKHKRLEPKLFKQLTSFNDRKLKNARFDKGKNVSFKKVIVVYMYIKKKTLCRFKKQSRTYSQNSSKSRKEKTGFKTNILSLRNVNFKITA
jgi:hypothetical protein